MNVLDNILADTRQKIDTLRAESADHARTAHEIAEQMAVPTEAYRAMEAEHRDLLLKVAALEDEMRTARTALDAMADERDTHLHKADSALNAADHFEQVTLPHMAVILDGAALPPREALDATGLMPRTEDGPDEEHKPPCDCPPGTCKADPFPDDDLVPPGGLVKDGRAEVAPFLPVTPPTPHDPAGQIIAVHGPGVTGPINPAMTMPDTGLNPPRLEPAQEGDGPRHRAHAKPGLIDRIRRTGGHPIIRDEQGDDRG